MSPATIITPASFAARAALRTQVSSSSPDLPVAMLNCTDCIVIGTEDATFVVGFEHARAALVTGFAWVDSERSEPDSTFTQVRVEASRFGPVGPWTEVGSWELQRTVPGTFTVDFDASWAKKLPERSFARRRYLDHVVEQALAVVGGGRLGTFAEATALRRRLAKLATSGT